MPTISLFGLYDNPKFLKFILPLCHQGQRVMLPLSTCWNLFFAMLFVLPLSTCWNLFSVVLSVLPLTIGKVYEKMFYKKKHDLLITKDSYIQPFPNQVGIYQYWLILPTKWGYTKNLHMIKQEHYIIHPKHSGETKTGHLMTLIIKEMHDIKTKYLRQDYDSHQKLSSAASIHHHSD